jgi:hypothetical protein
LPTWRVYPDEETFPLDGIQVSITGLPLDVRRWLCPGVSTALSIRAAPPVRSVPCEVLILLITRLVAIFVALVATFVSAPSPQSAVAYQNKTTPQSSTAAPAITEWSDVFDGAGLDETKWEAYTFEGGGGVKIEIKDKQLKLHGAGDSRSGVRSKPTFHGERFFVEAALTKVGPRNPLPGEQAFPPGFAIVAVLFDGSPTNRLEWILRSDGMFEAWVGVDGRMERVDNRKLATKEKSLKMGIARRGEQVYFMLNREVGLERTVRGLSQNFKVMLYGFGSSENNWDSIVVQTLKQ